MSPIVNTQTLLQTSYPLQDFLIFNMSSLSDELWDMHIAYERLMHYHDKQDLVKAISNNTLNQYWSDFYDKGTLPQNISYYRGKSSFFTLEEFHRSIEIDRKSWLAFLTNFDTPTEDPGFDFSKYDILSEIIKVNGFEIGMWVKTLFYGINYLKSAEGEKYTSVIQIPKNQSTALKFLHYLELSQPGLANEPTSMEFLKYS